MDIIPFNSVVEDQITGFKGAVKSRAEWLNNCIRYEVQPEINKDGHLPDAMVVDGMHLKVITPGPFPAISIPNTFELGVKMMDKLSKFSGIAVVRLKYPHAGDRYGLQQKVNEKQEIPEVKTFDEEDLKQIDPPPALQKKGGKKKPKPPNGAHDSHNMLSR